MNPLKIEIDDFLSKIANFEFLHFQTKTQLTYRIRDVKKQIETNNGFAPHSATSLIIGDLTGKSDNGWKLNYPTGFKVAIAKNEMVESLENLIKQNGMTYLANCYEILESFLFNILGRFLNNFPKYTEFLKPIDNNISDKKEYLRKYYRSKNNKELFKLLRQICPEFENSEINNNTGMNLKEWYIVITNVRHSIVHSLYLMNPKKLSFNENQQKIINTYFTNEIYTNHIKLKMSFEESKKQINLIAEFGFLIFKSLSVIENKDWKILKNMER